MKYGVLGDIHSNLSALNAVLKAMEADGIDQILSVGDVVGYGAAPGACIQLMRERDVKVVLGNHDAAVAEILDDAHFNPYARAAVTWTRTELDKTDIQWLRALPLIQTLEHCQVSHGTLAHPEQFRYALSPADAEPSLHILERPVCFVGHTHIPLTVMRFGDDPLRVGYSRSTDLDLTGLLGALINVGSVGQPRDDNPLAAYMVYDSVGPHATLHRVEYDIEREVARIASAGLPDVLGERLRLGV